MASKELRIGVIGSGGRGYLAAHAHKPDSGVRIVACCDTSEQALAENRKKYGEEIFTTGDYRRLLDQKLDAVMICTPDFLHEKHALAALERVRGVFLEKPMAITIAGCDRILAAARKKGARLFIGHNMRYMSIFRKMRQLINEGAIGRVKSVWCRHFICYGGDAYFRDWHSERKNTTGLLLQKGAHDIDMIHWLTGAYTKRVSAFGNLSVYGELPRRKDGQLGRRDVRAEHWPPRAQSGFSRKIDVEDQNAVIMELEGGIIASYLQCHFTPDSCRNYTVIGDEGRMENLGDAPEDPIMVWNKRRRDWGTYRIIGDDVHYGEATDTSGHGGADAVIVAEFLKHVRTGCATTATPEAARMAVATGCQATLSLRSGGTPMNVPPLQSAHAGRRR